MRNRYFMRIPASKMVREQFVEVDPEILHLGLLTEIYQLDPHPHKQGYVRAYGFEDVVNTGIDASELLARWEDLLEQIEAVLSNLGAAKIFAEDLRTAIKELPQLISLIASGKTQDANGALEAVGYGLLSMAATVSTKLQDFEARVARLGDQAEIMTDIVANRDDERLYHATAESLAGHVDEGLRAIRALDEYEAELDSLMEKVEAKSQDWQAISISPPFWLREQLGWLTDEETGFCTRASRFLINPDSASAETMLAMTEEARKRLELIKERMANKLQERTAAKQAVEAVLTRQLEVERLTRVIREAREQVAQTSRAGIDAFSLTKGLITAEEFAQWQVQERPESRFGSLHDVNLRLRHKAEAIRQYLDHEPRLGPEAEKALERVEPYIAKVHSLLRRLGLQVGEVEDEVPVRQAAEADAKQPLDPSSLSGSQLERVYEMALAVGAVKYCGPTNMIGGTPAAMLDILRILGRLSDEESRLYKQPLRERLEKDSYQVSDSENRLKAWKSVKPERACWIQFRVTRGRATPKFNMWRLTEQARQVGLRMLQKHDLRPEEIVQAYNTRCEQRRQQIAARR